MIINQLNNCSLSKNDISVFYKKYFPDRELNIDNPKTFTEKIQWLKFYDCIAEKTYCADKINLRNYCKKILDNDFCPKILKIYNNVSEIKYEDLPDRFILKCNHGSNMNIVCKNKAEFNFETAINKLAFWSNINFSDYCKMCEYHYNNIERKIFLEEFIDIECEYKFWCFNGITKLCQVIFYDDCPTIPNAPMDWRRLDILVDTNFNLTNFWFNHTGISRPYNIKEYVKEHYKKYKFDDFITFVNLSQRLANSFKFVRVDWYRTTNNKMYLSEMTFTPAAGIMKFESSESDVEIGKMLRL